MNYLNKLELIHLAPCLLAFASTIFLIFILVPFAINIKLVDLPDMRKLHHGEVPLIGGVAIVGGFTFAVLIADGALSEWKPLFLAMLPLIIVGILDDHKQLGVKIRILVQVITCLIMIYKGGIRFDDLGDLFGTGNVNLDGLQTVFTVIVILLLINALNLIDGVDGLSSSLALATLISIVLLVKVDELSVSISLVLYFCSALFAFFLVNIELMKKWVPKVFLGDCGTTVIGFFIGWILIKSSQGDSAIFRPVTCLWLISVPLIDLFYVVLIRVKSGQSPFVGDRQHIHHNLQKLGLSKYKILLYINIIHLVFIGIGVFGELYLIRDVAMLAGWLTLCLIYIFCMMKFVRPK